MEYDNKITPRFSTVIDYRYRINTAMKFIQENHGEPLDIKVIAEVASFSPFHFHRIFAGYLGETLAEYIRKVRMKKAASLLSAGLKITDVAMESGYQTTSAFSKVFRQTFGITPSEFKCIEETDKIKFPHTPPYSRINQNIIIHPRIVEESSHTLFYIRRKLNEKGLLNENIGKAFHDAFDEWYQLIDFFHLWGHLFRRLGVIRGFTSISPEKCHYDAGIIFNRKVTFPGLQEVKSTEIAKGRWAVFLHKGPYNTLWQTWNWIYNYWCRVSGFEIRETDPYEVYLNYKSNTLPEDLLTEIYIPIH